MKRLMIKYTIKNDRTWQAENAIVPFVAAVASSEQGTIKYDVYRSGKNQYIHLAEFDDEMAQLRHNRSSYAEDFYQAILPLCEQRPQAFELETVISSQMPVGEIVQIAAMHT